MHYNTFDSFFDRYVTFVQSIMRQYDQYNTEPEDVYVKNEADDSVGERDNKDHYGNWTGEKSDIDWDEIEVRRLVTCKEDITMPFKLSNLDSDIYYTLDNINIMRKFMFEITKDELSSYRAKNSEHIKFLLMNNFDKIKVFDPLFDDDLSGDKMFYDTFMHAYMQCAFEYFIEYDIEESRFRFCSNKFKEWKDLKNLISESKFIPLCIH